MSGLLDNVTGLLEGFGTWAKDKVMALINGFFPPERRYNILSFLFSRDSF